MTVLLTVLGLTALGAAAFVIFRAVRYGGLRQAFDGSLAEDRKALAEARADCKRAEKARHKELADAENAFNAARAAYDGAVQRAAAWVAELEDPGAGRQLTRLGPVTLHEHAVVLQKMVLPLHGMRARVESTAETSYLYLQLPDGQQMQHGYSTTWRGTGDTKVNVKGHGDYDTVSVQEKMKRDFSDEQVREFCTLITNAAVSEAHFVEQRPAMLEEARGDLATAQADTGPVAHADQSLQQLRAGSPMAVAAEAAQARLASVEQAWRSKTATVNA
jgi:hypothetical protein